MSTKKRTEAGEMVTVKIPFPEEYTYSNCVAIASCEADFRLGFGDARDGTDIRAVVGVVMSPEGASRLAVSLVKQLQAFESAFGELRNEEWRSLKI